MKSRALSAVAATLLLTACVGANVGEHVRAPDYSGNPKRIFVLNGLDSRFSQKAVDSFGPEIQTRLTSCGVAALVVRPNRMELNATARIGEAMSSFKPDAVLNIRQTERVSRDGSTIFGEYVVTLTEVERKREVWKASISLSTFLGERERGGPEFAATLIRQLTADAVLSSCPSSASVAN